MTVTYFTDPRNYPNEDRNKNPMDRVAEIMDDYQAEIDGVDRGQNELLAFLSTLDFGPSRPKGEPLKFPER